VEALQRIEQVLASRNDSYWSRIAGIKRQALHAWVVLTCGDTTGALREAKVAAELEDGTEKAPVTPGELIPARELEADMHLLAATTKRPVAPTWRRRRGIAITCG
jgi:hypothetical protein